MKNIKNKTKILIAIVALIIIIGTVIIFTNGLNFDLKYREMKKVEFYLEKEFDNQDIKKITDEVLEGQEVLIQKVEVYGDTVGILSNNITDEQKTKLVDKVNEKYGTEIKKDDVKIVTVPKARGRDIIKPYIVPFVLTTLLILVYMCIRYHKISGIKKSMQAGLIILVSQMVLLSLIAITRIPVGILTIPMVIAVYVLSILGVTHKFENELKEKEIENKKKEK